MFAKLFSSWLVASLTGLGLAAQCPVADGAQDMLAAPGKLQEVPAGSVRLTLEEAKQQALAKTSCSISPW